ncbi:ATP/cobalamin adenosyltransferase [Ancylobacter novellus DSM 506]|uniref:Corrinoid adenosyltransferase n=1 Tax=Ancylobacter novellus (strain ATCC 8093 / DSM 506 / JCM 20403 / CCM 1077 / IAM 12100 / NBRC 12443 / NCIMB 10456) TaxID=639283 RepID=D7A5U1_ANCN5|nr:cob(I)yrinic acid a,c-diamide adenosyltransferase [Ancylobacter novellus]ADH90056.1 ATP/cobalamin adenosyltransferase [Ancylobacter novellus DSM 506]
MGHRLSRIVTRTGDQGQTGLGSGLRVDKDSPPIETLGAIDELNSWIGVLVALSSSQATREVFTLVQHDLFDLGAQISVPGTPLLSRAHLSRIEAAFEQVNAGLGMLEEFILPGGAPASAFAHVARTVCRRAERRLFSLTQIERSAPELHEAGGAASPPENFGLSYLNRLSDLLFVVSRLENRADGRADVLWERGKSLGSGVAA